LKREIAESALKDCTSEEMDSAGLVTLAVIQSKVKIRPNYEEIMGLRKPLEKKIEVTFKTPEANSTRDEEISKLTALMKNLALVVSSLVQQKKEPRKTEFQSKGDNARVKWCVICDLETCTQKRNSKVYKELVSKNKIKIGIDGFAEWPNGSKIQTNYGRGGIAKLVAETDSQKNFNSLRIEYDERKNQDHTVRKTVASVELIQGELDVLRFWRGSIGCDYIPFKNRAEF
jgi:hypothetical protein